FSHRACRSAGSTRRPRSIASSGCAGLPGCSIRKNSPRTSGRARAPSSGFFISSTSATSSSIASLPGPNPAPGGGELMRHGAFVLLLGALVAALLWGLAVGPYPLSLADVFHAAARAFGVDQGAPTPGEIVFG